MYASVILKHNEEDINAKEYLYRVPFYLRNIICVGDVVRVPCGKNSLLAARVVSLAEELSEPAPFEVKDIVEVIESRQPIREETAAATAIFDLMKAKISTDDYVSLFSRIAKRDAEMKGLLEAYMAVTFAYGDE